MFWKDWTENLLCFLDFAYFFELCLWWLVRWASSGLCPLHPRQFSLRCCGLHRYQAPLSLCSSWPMWPWLRTQRRWHMVPCLAGRCGVVSPSQWRQDRWRLIYERASVFEVQVLEVTSDAIHGLQDGVPLPVVGREDGVVHRTLFQGLARSNGSVVTLFLIIT